MFSAIEKIYWDTIGVEQCQNENKSCFVIWPGPVNHDTCFMQAGFDHFDGPSAEWETEFSILGSCIYTYLFRYGSAKRIAPNQATAARALRKFIDSFNHCAMPNLDLLLASTNDDQIGEVRVAFGPAADLSVYTGNGHELFWIEKNSNSPFELNPLITILTAYAPCKQKKLEWNYLLL